MKLTTELTVVAPMAVALMVPLGRRETLPVVVEFPLVVVELPALVAPVAAIRESRSAVVVHVMLVPGESTSGSAAHL